MKSALLQESPVGASKSNGSAQSLVRSLFNDALTVVRVPGGLETNKKIVLRFG
ncbi:MAG: hypothetical protein AB1861_20955 [Cyanobacteriota bacterium]